MLSGLPVPTSLNVLENTEDGEPTVSLHRSLDKEILLKFNLSISSCSLWLVPPVLSSTAKVVGSILFLTLFCGPVGGVLFPLFLFARLNKFNSRSFSM